MRIVSALTVVVCGFVIGASTASCREPEELSVEINESLCLSPKQLEDEMAAKDLLSYRRLGDHFRSCGDEDVDYIQYFRKAADMGTAYDVARYAEEYLEVEGEEGAFPLFLTAAKRGDTRSKMYVAKVLFNQPSEVAESLAWFESAARDGNWEAMLRLSDYANRSGNHALALAWLRLAQETAPTEMSERLSSRLNSRVHGQSHRNIEAASVIGQTLPR